MFSTSSYTKEKIQVSLSSQPHPTQKKITGKFKFSTSSYTKEKIQVSLGSQPHPTQKKITGKFKFPNSQSHH